MSGYGSNANSPGYLESVASTKRKTKEDIRIDQLIPSEILEKSDGIKTMLEFYYKYQNMKEFIYQEVETHTDVITSGKANFRILDPENSNDHFYSDSQGANSTLTVTNPDGSITAIALSSTNVAISNGNELPGTLANSTSALGKTFTVSGLTAHNAKTATLTTIVKYWVGPGPSYVINAIEEAMNIDQNADEYLQLMQKEIAASLPRDITVDKRNLYKTITDFYKIKGAQDSVEVFFRLLFNDEVEVIYPWDSTLKPSDGTWDIGTSAYLDRKGKISEKSIRVQDSNYWQKFSYLIRTGQNLSKWNASFEKLVHPAGFKFFGEILILIALTRSALGDGQRVSGTATNGTGQLFEDVYSRINRFTLSSMPGLQPGTIGAEDVPVLVEAFVATFSPNVEARIHRSATLSVTTKQGGIISIGVTAGGSGYTVAPNKIDIVDSDGYTTATAVATVNSGAVNAINMVTSGENYGVPGVVTVTLGFVPYARSTAFAQGAIIKHGANLYTVTTAGTTSSNSDPTHNSGAAASGSATLTFNSVAGTGATAAVTEVGANMIKAITTVDKGYGYAVAPAITITGTGSSATATCALDDEGQIDSITVTNEGKNYTQANAIAAANPNNSKIQNLYLSNLGDKRYKTAPTLVIDAPTATDQEGVLLTSNIQATATLQLDAEGEISGFTLVEDGSGYVRNPLVKIGSPASSETRGRDIRPVIKLELNHTDEDPTTSMVLNPLQSNGSLRGSLLVNGNRNLYGGNFPVDSVTVTAGGSGYSSATVAFSGGGAVRQATGTVTLSSGAVTGITVTDGGHGYTSAPTVTISGDGSSATATAVVTLNVTLTQQSATADKKLPAEYVLVRNPAFKTQQQNSYFGRKGDDWYQVKKFRDHVPMREYKNNLISNVSETVINKYNVMSNLTQS